MSDARFQITRGKGFVMTFANGWTISVQFGTSNYCENRSLHGYDVPPGESLDTYLVRREREAGEKGCANAEIAVWDHEKRWASFGYDNVSGWLSPDDVAEAIGIVSNLDRHACPKNIFGKHFRGGNADRRAALDYAHVCYRAEGGN